MSHTCVSDNLAVMSRYSKDGSVDLVYLDPEDPDRSDYRICIGDLEKRA